MSVLLDTSVVVDVLRASGPALEYAGSLEDLPLCSEITRVEVMRGVGSRERGSTERLFGAIRWIGVDEPIARQAGEMGRTWRRSHPGISIPDLLIAATAAEWGLELATLNVKRFPMFKGLRPPYRS